MKLNYIMEQLYLLLKLLEDEKPNDRSEIDRRFAIVITDLEKIEAYLQYHIVSQS